jgi:hypothetical protein
MEVKDLSHGDFYAERGYIIALSLKHGKHFIFHDDDERPWLEWDKEHLTWLKEYVGKDNWNSLYTTYQYKRYIIFKNEADAIKWKLVWG